MLDKMVSSFTVLIAPVYMAIAIAGQQWRFVVTLFAWWWISRSAKLLPHLRRRPSSFFLVPAFLSTNLIITAPLFFLGGFMLALPSAPGEALVSDVVVAELRGRAATLRSVVRSLAAFSPVIIGAIADVIGLRLALAVVTPLYAVGGVVMLFAARHYAYDLSFVAAESERIRAGVDGPGAPTPAVDSPGGAEPSG